MEPQQVGDRHRARASVALDLGRFAVAEKEARSALAINPRDVTAQLYLCRAYLGLSAYDRAIESAHAAIALAPSDAYAYYLAGFAMQVAGRGHDAIDMLREAVRLHPSAPRYHARLAIAQLDVKDLAGARASIDKAMALDPDNASLVDEAARVYGILDAVTIAEDLARRLIRLEPDAATSHWRLAWVLGLAKRHREASESARAALRIDPNYWPGWEELGYSLLESNQLDDAHWALREALRLKPGLTSATINLATVLERTGFIADALEVCEATLLTAPDNARVRRTYDRLVRERSRRETDLASQRASYVMLLLLDVLFAISARHPGALIVASIAAALLCWLLWSTYRPAQKAPLPSGDRRP